MVDAPRPVNRFDSLFQQADSVFSKKLETALEKSKKKREKALSVSGVKVIVQELKRKEAKQ